MESSALQVTSRPFLFFILIDVGDIQAIISLGKCFCVIFLIHWQQQCSLAFSKILKLVLHNCPSFYLKPYIFNFRLPKCAIFRVVNLDKLINLCICCIWLLDYQGLLQQQGWGCPVIHIQQFYAFFRVFHELVGGVVSQMDGRCHGLRQEGQKV